MVESKVVLITGASSGIGKATAEAFVSRGFRVFGTSRERRADCEGVSMLTLDVTDEANARACVAEVVARAGRVDVLVNNAGVMVMGPVEEVGLDAAHSLFETNFWGVARMVNAVLPIMRACGGGHIINIGSIAGVVAIPMNGYYAATKHALSGYTEALRHEVMHQGVRVALVEPGDYRTGLWEANPIAPPQFGVYADLRARVSSAIASLVATAEAPTPVAEAVVRLAESESPPLRTRVGKWAHLLPKMKAVMPQQMFETGTRRRFAIETLV